MDPAEIFLYGFLVGSAVSFWACWFRFCLIFQEGQKVADRTWIDAAENYAYGYTTVSGIEQPDTMVRIGERRFWVIEYYGIDDRGKGVDNDGEFKR